MPYFETADGTRLAYEDYGTGKPIMFVASWALGADMWEYQVPFFVEQGYRCVLLDRRGHGRSDRPSGGYDIDTRADDLATLVEHLDLREITLVGHSAGGGEVARYLVRHGEERVSRVAFVSAVLPFLKRTDDNPHGAPEMLCEAVIAQFRKDPGPSGSPSGHRGSTPPTWATTPRPRWSTSRCGGAWTPRRGRRSRCGVRPSTPTTARACARSPSPRWWCTARPTSPRSWR
ncbi:alpha/beta hydrolase [Streptosporangium sp. NPDC020145]|uniref:alpha/beta fold hydrolase n=1 Tax=Streptosporangium sp. NPDC020145 TaxID=3154694 RepID=UPI0034224664